MLRFLTRALLALLFTVATASPAFATDMVQWWYGVNPQTSWWNTTSRDIRIGDGVYWYNALAGAGVYANLCITPGSGLNVSVAPCNSTPASLYQVLPDDANSFGGPGATALPADSTPIELQGQLSTAQAFSIGPLNPPSTSGQSIIYALECTVQTFDTNLQNVNYVNAFNQVTPGTANRDRVGRVFCQSKAGTAATSPTPPTIDAGYIGAAQTTVAYGASSIGTVTMTTANSFNGYARLNSSGFINVSVLPHGDYVDLANAQTIAGVKTFSSAPVMSGASINSATIPASALAGSIGQSLITNGYVDLSSTQTIGGAKTFSTFPYFSGATSGVCAVFSTGGQLANGSQCGIPCYTVSGSACNSASHFASSGTTPLTPTLSCGTAPSYCTVSGGSGGGYLNLTFPATFGTTGAATPCYGVSEKNLAIVQILVNAAGSTITITSYYLVAGTASSPDSVAWTCGPGY